MVREHNLSFVEIKNCPKAIRLSWQCCYHRGPKTWLNNGFCAKGSYAAWQNYIFPCDRFCDKFYKFIKMQQEIQIELGRGNIVGKAKFFYSLGLHGAAVELLKNNGYDPKEILKDEESNL